MEIFKNAKNYSVYLEEDGDDFWITVTNGHCRIFACYVGQIEPSNDVVCCLETAAATFYPKIYIDECSDHVGVTAAQMVQFTKDAY